jgi:hypothetical protein
VEQIAGCGLRPAAFSRPTTRRMRSRRETGVPADSRRVDYGSQIRRFPGEIRDRQTAVQTDGREGDRREARAV